MMARRGSAVGGACLVSFFGVPHLRVIFFKFPFLRVSFFFRVSFLGLRRRSDFIIFGFVGRRFVGSLDEISVGVWRVFLPRQIGPRAGFIFLFPLEKSVYYWRSDSVVPQRVEWSMGVCNVRDFSSRRIQSRDVCGGRRKRLVGMDLHEASGLGQVGRNVRLGLEDRTWRVTALLTCGADP